MRGIQPLLPDDFGDEALAGIKFAEEFSNRYGQPSPQFFPGKFLLQITRCTILQSTLLSTDNPIPFLFWIKLK